jgi:hypothetical protein
MAKPADVSSTRHVLDSEAVLRELGYLRELSGTWEGEGFSLIARPNFRDQANLYLQINQTRETLVITPIGSAIPNRGFGQGDIELFGLSYLQKIHDHYTGSALHLEPGLWITQPPTMYPLQYPPPNGRIIARMASIPHGSAVLAQGSTTSFSGAPTLPTKTQIYNGSVFHSFNSTPFYADRPFVNAADSSQRLTAARFPMPRFDEYDLSRRESAANPRTPFATSPPEPPLPQQINDELMQDVINDPIRLLRARIRKQVRDGCTFEGFALNIATQPTVTFRLRKDSPSTGPTVNVRVAGGTGGIENILFLEGGEPTGAKGPNAQPVLAYATFWIEKVRPKRGRQFMQLQYAQMAVLNFPIFKLLNPPQGGPGQLEILGWPHISLATLRKAL